MKKFLAFIYMKTNNARIRIKTAFRVLFAKEYFVFTAESKFSKYDNWLAAKIEIITVYKMMKQLRDDFGVTTDMVSGGDRALSEAKQILSEQSEEDN